MSESEHFALERHETGTGALLDWYLYRKIGEGDVLLGSIYTIAEARELCLLLQRAVEHEHLVARGGDDRKQGDDPTYQGSERRSGYDRRSGHDRRNGQLPFIQQVLETHDKKGGER
jgi:hypothetical protein